MTEQLSLSPFISSATFLMYVIDIYAYMYSINTSFHTSYEFRNVFGPLYLTEQDCGFPGGTSGKEPPCQCRRCRRLGFDPWVRKIPWKKKWQPTPVFLPGELMDGGAWWAKVHRATES